MINGIEVHFPKLSYCGMTNDNKERPIISDALSFQKRHNCE